MAIVKPFRGLRPRNDLVAKVACPPYDVLSSEEARIMAQNNPLSFLHVAKSEIDLKPDIDLYDDRVYEKARENFQKFIKDGVLVRDGKDSFYIYQQIMGDHRQVGLLACVSVDDYLNNIIKKHELTRPDKELDRTKHIDCVGANTGLVFLTYRAKAEIDWIIESCVKRQPVYDFVDEQTVRHTVWIVDDSATIRNLAEAFGRLDAIYIADGHHRSASSCRVRDIRKEKHPDHTGREEYNYFTGVLFPDNQVKILPYNRAVATLNEMSAETFLQKIGERGFEVEAAPSNDPHNPERQHTFGMYLEGKWYRLTARKEIIVDDDPIERLDVQILQKNLLGPILGIEDPRKDKRIDFIGGIRGLGELKKRVDSKRLRVAFALFPATVDDLMRIANAGRIMPPKSTWFEPKLKSGLVMHLLN
ncbi:MAG: DUF1015 family protein [Acidobacteriota bacterium]